MAKCPCLLKSVVQVQRVSELRDPPNIDVLFGKVPFTSRRSKELVLDFEDKEIEHFAITVSESHKTGDDVFIITPSEGLYKKGTRLKLKCIFVPRIAFQRYLTQFDFCAKDTFLTISLKGDSSGTSLTISTNIVQLFQHPRDRVGRAVIELRNTCDIPAEFSINFDSKQKLFSVTPTSGVCTDLTFIAINFSSPEKFGAYSQQINCLVYGCPPIIINVLGVYSKKLLSPKKVTIVYYPFNFDEKSSYRACFPHKKDDKEKPYPIVLNTTFLDLGRALVKELFDEESTVATKNFSLNNNLDTEVIVNWIEDDKVFSIYPKKVTVSSNGRMYFKCVFSPTYSQTCFCRTFTAQVYWRPRNIKSLPACENVIIVPLTISITVQGHSYPEDQIPMGHLEMINNVIEFAEALPNQNVYQNFKITNKGTRPTMFKFVPPNPVDSRVAMIPMCGIIKDFAVILAQYKPTRRPRTLIEHWQLILNGQDEKKINFKVVGYTELPSLRVGSRNEINFQSIQIHTIARKKVSLYNLSNFNINFKFVEPDHGYITFEPVQGIISRREVIHITCIFEATPCCPRVNKILIIMHALQNLHLLIGPSCEHYFTVNATSTYSELTATPLVDEFYLLEYGTVINTSFQLHNFGVSTVYFKIIATNLYLCGDVLIIDPIFGQVDPRNSITVNLSLECRTLGVNRATIEYFPRSDAESEEHAKDCTHLLTFPYACQISILKISEIVEHDFGPLFSKRDFWSLLRIDDLNELLNNLRPDQTESLTVNLPECPVGNQNYITLLIENNTDLNTEIQLKRIQLCKCKKKKTTSPYRVEYSLNCVHRDTLYMEISQGKVDRRTSQQITINVSYCIVGNTQIAYEVYLRPARKIILYFNIYGIDPNRSRASVYNNNFTIDMNCGFLTAKNPPSQIFWFYNNSSISAILNIDLSDVRRLNEENKFDIFECTYSKTPISPGGIWPFMIKFMPTELQTYKVTVNILMNEKMKVLTIQGFGVKKPNVEEFFECSMPQECKSTNNFPMRFSKDNIFIKCLPTWRFEEKLIFVENLTTTKLLYYEFADVDIEGLIKIVAIEKTGILRPGSSKTVTIKVQSFNESVLANFNLPCTVTDLQMMYALKKRKATQTKKYQADEFQFSNPAIKPKEVKEVQSNSDIHGQQQINYSMTVTVSVNIVDRKDLLAFTDDPNNVFQFNIPETLPVDIKCTMSNPINRTDGLVCNIYKKHAPLCGMVEADLIENIFEKVISEVLFNDAFPKIISSIFEDVPLYYSQLALDDRSFEEKSRPLEDAVLKELKENEIDKFFSRPTASVLAETFTSMIKDSLHDTFDLTSPSQQLADEQAIQDTMEHINEVCTLKDCLCPSMKIC